MKELKTLKDIEPEYIVEIRPSDFSMGYFVYDNRHSLSLDYCFTLWGAKRYAKKLLKQNKKFKSIFLKMKTKQGGDD